MSEFLYVPNSGSNTVSVIDTATNALITTITVEGAPDSAVASPDGAFVYLASESGIVSVISTSTNTVVAAIPVIPAPQTEIARAYVACDGNVSVIDTASQSLVTNITIGSTSTMLAMSLDGAHLYVNNYYGLTTSVIDTASNTVIATIDLDAQPYGIVLNPDGTHAYIATNGGILYDVDT